eukprot:1156170-Pelagomonas_calceolata.AAC.5
METGGRKGLVWLDTCSSVSRNGALHCHHPLNAHSSLFVVHLVAETARDRDREFSVSSDDQCAQQGCVALGSKLDGRIMPVHTKRGGGVQHCVRVCTCTHVHAYAGAIDQLPAALAQ